MARKRRSVAEEIAQTEKNYVSLLLTTIEVLTSPLLLTLRCACHACAVVRVRWCAFPDS
jgi:hypothetical protein